MAESQWGLCKDCKWWQIEPEAGVENLTLGLCIDEDLQRFRLRVSGNSGCSRFLPGKPATCGRFERGASDCPANTLSLALLWLSASSTCG